MEASRRPRAVTDVGPADSELTLTMPRDHPGDEARYCLITSWESGPELDAYIQKYSGVSYVESYPLSADEIAAGEALAQSKRDARAAALAARGQDPRFGDGTLTVLEEQMGGGMETEQLSEA